MVYLVSYELNAENGNVSNVLATINRIGETNPCIGSSLLLDTSMSVGDVYKSITPVLGPGDTVFITPIQYDSCAGRTMSGSRVWEWLKVHPK